MDPTRDERSVTPHEVASRMQAGGFFWLDLESTGGDELAQYSESLRLPSRVTTSHLQTDVRSSFTVRDGAIQAVLPAAVDTEATVWLEANYVTVVLTERFLLTAHSQPCNALQRAREQYLDPDDQDARSDPARPLFLVVDDLIDSFRPQLLALDDRLAEIELGMLQGASPKVQDELVQILGILTDGIQELGWYAHDIEANGGTLRRLLGKRASAHEHIDRHRQRVSRMTENGKEIREEAKDALRQYSEVVAGRQAHVLGSLTIIATVFLPLSFITGYFGMNFTTLTAHVQTGLWAFLLLGLLLPVASAGLSLSLIHRLERRYGVKDMG